MAIVEDRDMGWNQVVASIGDLKELGVLVGIQQEDGDQESEDGATLAQYASANEFGGKNPETGRLDHPPQRSYLRSTTDENEQKYDKALGKQIGRVIDGTLPAKQALGIVGEQAVGDVKRKIRTLRTPPNAESTIAAKGSSNPLIGVPGRLRASIKKKVVKGDKPL